jgi:hypothetical protein
MSCRCPLAVLVLVALAGCPAPSDDDPTDTPATDAPGTDSPDSDTDDGRPDTDGGPGDACVPEPARVDDACLTTGTPTITPGIGERAYEPIEAGAHLAMVNGPQGGWHVTASAFAENLPQRSTVRFVLIHDATGTVISDSTSNLAFRPTEGEWACEGSVYNVQAVIDPGLVPSASPGARIWTSLCGVPLTLRVEVSKEGACLAEGERSFIVQPDPCNCAACDAPEGFPLCPVTDPDSPRFDPCAQLSCDTGPAAPGCEDTDVVEDSGFGAALTPPQSRP